MVNWTFLFVFFFTIAFGFAQDQLPIDPNLNGPGSSSGPVPNVNSQATFSADPSEIQSPPPAPLINWGECKQLEPTEQEKREKAEIIKQCLERIPLPENITQSAIELHRTEVARCALEREGWFDEHRKYRYDKAEAEIRKKKLSENIEEAIIQHHGQCKTEAQSKFPGVGQVIPQIQLYQACMDYHISQVCGIQITYPGLNSPTN